MKIVGFTIIMLGVILLGVMIPVQTLSQTPIIPDEATRAQLVTYLRSICDWSIRSELRTGELKIAEKRRSSVFINSNLARVLIAGYEITQENSYLDEALAWFDRLVELQQPTTTMNDLQAGYWGDFGPDGNIYLGDAGTSATALAGAVRFANPERRLRYLRALELYANFVRFGTKEDPQGRGRGGSNGWVINSGPDAGALGCGYYRNELSPAPYTISTSVTGVAFFSCLADLTGNSDYMTIAEDAARWLLKIRDPFGEFPYILHNFQLDEWPLDTMSYVADGIIGVHLRSANATFKREVEKSITRSIQWLVMRQNRDGSWGKLRSEDQQRSQGVLNLLVWFYNDVMPNTAVLNAIRANYSYFLNPANSKAFGVLELPITTGFVGLGIAEVLVPDITYRLK